MPWLSHEPGSATDDLYPSSYNASSKNTINAMPDDFNRYNTCTTSIFLPPLEPNSGPAVIHIFLRQGAVKYAFCISHPSVDKPLGAAIVREIQMLSLETADEYVMDEGDTVM